MYYKSLVLALFVSFLSFLNSGSAQTAAPHREVGLQFSNINFSGSSSFSAFYKKELKENVYRRLRFFYGNVNTAFINDNASFNFNAGVAIGREKRKSLDSKLAFYQGPEVSLGISTSSATGNSSNYSLNGRFGWVLGLQHSFNDRWAINLETIPGIGIGVSGGENRSTAVDVGASFNNTVSLGLVRKF